MPAAQLTPLSIGVPAFMGLNTERQTSLLGPEWATVLDNIVFDEAGRVAARKGKADYATPTGKVKSLAEWSTGGLLIGAGSAIYLDGATVTGTMTTPSDANWKMVEFNSKILGFQDNHTPFTFNGSSCSDLSVTHGGAMPTTWSGIAHAAYGRVWVMDSTRQVLKYSALLDETDFDESGTITDATAGHIDLKSVWKNGLDSVEAITSHNGNLVLFGKQSILIYNNPYYPNSKMSLIEDVGGVGCIARDTVQEVGEDVWFLSSSGVRSLGRTVVKDKMPLTDFSRNVRSYLIQHVNPVNDKTSIKATYNEKEGFYILSSPTASRAFVFDVRAPLEDGSVRVSTWSGNVPTALLSARTDKLFFGGTDEVTYYGSYKDSGDSYTMKYVSGWMTIGEDNPGVRYTIPKRANAIVYSGTNATVSFNWKFDFATTGYTYSKTLSGVVPSEWGVSEWGLGEWGGGGGLSTVRIPMKGKGNLIKLEVSSVINGHQLALQKIDIFAKLGRIN